MPIAGQTPLGRTVSVEHCAADAAARAGSANGAGAPAPQSLLLPTLELLVSLAPLGLVSLGELGAPGLLSPDAPPGLFAALAPPASPAPCLVLLRLLRQLATPASPLLPLPAALGAPLRFVGLRLLCMPMQGGDTMQAHAAGPCRVTLTLTRALPC